jgi:hypothetical protein
MSEVDDSGTMERTVLPRRFLFKRRALHAALFILESHIPRSEHTMNIFYIIGVVVVIIFIAGFFGLHT